MNFKKFFMLGLACFPVMACSMSTTDGIAAGKYIIETILKEHPTLNSDVTMISKTHSEELSSRNYKKYVYDFTATLDVDLDKKIVKIDTLETKTTTDFNYEETLREYNEFIENWHEFNPGAPIPEDDDRFVRPEEVETRENHVEHFVFVDQYVTSLVMFSKDYDPKLTTQESVNVEVIKCEDLQQLNQNFIDTVNEYNPYELTLTEVEGFVDMLIKQTPQSETVINKISSLSDGYLETSFTTFDRGRTDAEATVEDCLLTHAKVTTVTSTETEEMEITIALKDVELTAPSYQQFVESENNNL